MTKIRTEVLIEAPPERVWAVVHEDLKNAPRWTTNLKKIELLNGGVPGPGSRMRYHLDIPGWKGYLELEQDTWTPPKKCAGTFIGGPIKGTWSYTYRVRKAGTELIYEMDYELGGMLRFVGGALKGRYEEGILETMDSLKEYVEAGRGPRTA